MSQPSFGQLFTEVLDPALWLVTSAYGNDRGGLIATFVTNASLVLNDSRVVIGIAKHHFTWSLIERSHSFSLHLVDRSRVDWVRRFGLQSGHAVDKLANLSPAVGLTGCPLFTDATLWAECALEATLDTGDRSRFLGRVTRCGQGTSGFPLTMSHLSALLDDSDRATLEQRLAQDIATDAQAIAAWRANRVRHA
jgi:flavin reductase (DIM6/NTAB) family NADH-FMN oxidoreductase RutF